MSLGGRPRERYTEEERQLLRDIAQLKGTLVLMKCKFETVGDDKTIEVLQGFLEKKLCTGNIGDGKIFVEKVADVIRVRTGQRGEEAL